MPVTEKMLKDLRALKSAVYVELRQYEAQIPRGFNYPVVALMETQLSIVDGKFKAVVHGETFALWQMQEMPEVIWPAFLRLREQLQGYGKNQITGAHGKKIPLTRRQEQNA